ncbi:MAG: CAP domain-containing protein [Bacillota bacterium]
MNSRKFLATGFLVVLLTLCLAVAAFAAPGMPGDQGAPAVDAALQSGNAAAVPSILTDTKDTKNKQKVPQNQNLENQPVIGQAVSAKGEESRDKVYTGQYPVLGVETVSLTAEEQQMLDLVNQERSSRGVRPLQADSTLVKVARLKARDFVENNYFSHTSPTYGSLRNMLDRFGVKYTRAGENLAAAYSVTRAHNALMKSSGNRANILSTKYKRVGIGIADNGRYKYFVEIFTDGGESQPPSGGTAPPPGTGPVKPPASDPTTPGQPGTGDTSAAGLTADEKRMLDLVNSERARNGQALLKPNLKLTGLARLKARDMIEKNYFSHTSPTYGSPFDMMRQFGITYRTAGENLAGAPTVDMAHTNLMNSPGHRANILNGSFKEVGIGIISGGPYGKMFVQMFIG